jgi:GT2 family glycosyltransferase
MPPVAAVIIPAHNESSHISRTLQAVTQGAAEGELEVVVVCNGCTDDTASIASAFAGVDVIEIAEASKLAALRSGDERATVFPRVYLDADVALTTEAIRSIAADLQRPGILVAGVPGQMDLSEASLPVALFYEFRERLPVFAHGLIGSGNYALNEAGRARFGRWPELKSGDDQFMFRLFEPHERATVSGHRTMVLPPSGLRAVVRRGVRTTRGNRNLTAGAAGHPLEAPSAGRAQALRDSLSSPRGVLSAIVFVAVTGAIRMRTRLSSGGSDWGLSARNHEPASSNGIRPITVVTVTFNATGHLPGMLESLRYEGNRPVEVVAIDNGSTDGSIMLLEGEDGVICAAQGNTGFAHGVNRGISLARPGSDILILNPDVRLQPDAVRTMAGVLDRYPDVGIVAPRLVDEYGKTLRSCRRSPSIVRTIIEAVVGGTRAGPFGEAYLPGDQPHEVDWATGAALLLRRRMLDAIGGMDEAFFLYSEETELCLRARQRGFHVMVEPRATVMHLGGGLEDDSRLWALRAVNRVRRYRRAEGPIGGIGFRMAQILFELRRSITGNAVSRAALRSLLARDLDAEAVRLAIALGGDAQPMQRRRSEGREGRPPARAT